MLVIFIVDTFLTFLSDDETPRIHKACLEALHRFAASENIDLQRAAALYYLDLSHCK